MMSYQLHPHFRSLTIPHLHFWTIVSMYQCIICKNFQLEHYENDMADIFAGVRLNPSILDKIKN